MFHNCSESENGCQNEEWTSPTDGRIHWKQDSSSILEGRERATGSTHPPRRDDDVMGYALETVHLSRQCQHEDKGAV